MNLERVFSMDTSAIKFGAGATREVGPDAGLLGLRRVGVFIDPQVARQETGEIVRRSLAAEGIDYAVFDSIRVEPTDMSFREAIRFATDGRFDGYVAVGGGSTMDTAKAANLYATHPAELLTFVNAPIGQGKPVPGPLRPLIAIPTTAGTGSETTGTAIFDMTALHAKTGIAHRALRPTLGIVDPDNTRSLPRMVAACTGLDVLSHAIESLTALPYNKRPAPEHPRLRPAYQGANPISDIWSSYAISSAARFLLRAVDDPSDDEARGRMLLAAAAAGIGFGNAGVHLPHGMSYAVAGQVRSYHAPDYPRDHAMVPHGMAVVLNAPAVFCFTGPAAPEAHLNVASLLAVDTRGAHPEDGGELVARALIDLMRRLGLPNGLSGVGYGPADVDKLVEGTLPQHRVTKLSPRPVDAPALKQLFLDAMRYW